MNVAEALRQWINYRQQMERLYLVAGSTVRNQRAITLVLAAGLGDHELDKLRKSHIELWMGERLQTCAPVTVRGEMNVLRQVLNWCVDEGHLLTKPRLPTLTVPNVEANLPSDEAFLWVLANVPEQHARALEFMMLTGLSPHEIERVQLRDVKVGELSTEIGIGQRADFPVKQASRRRWVPLNGRAYLIWHQASAGITRLGPVFPSVAAMQKAIRRATVAGGKWGAPLKRLGPLGAEAISPKLMRKWFASKVAGQQPEHVLQRLMGHAPGSPITRRHYVRSSEGQGRDAVADLTI